MEHGLPLVEELIPAPDPWETAKRLSGLPHLLFLDSADRHIRPTEHNRYSYVAADPVRWISGRTDDPVPPSMDELRKILAECRIPTIPELPPFQGGVAGLFGYELAHLFEKLPRPKHPSHTPDLAVGVYDWVISWDHELGRAWIVSTGGNDRDQAAKRWVEVKSWLSTTTERVAWPLKLFQEYRHYELPGYEGPFGVISNFTPEEYCTAVRRVLEYIRSGDCFQVNLAQELVRLRHPERSPVLFHERLRKRNPASFAAVFALDDWSFLVSASPEQFLRVDTNGHVTTRPIKGTAPRFEDPARDAASMSQLRKSEKDISENVMIVDLLRNDLGRVCEYASIKVTRVCELETFSTVHHLVSQVEGDLRASKSPLDLFFAAFPGGSVTGAPKIRAMQIISELEPIARGAYCGSLAFFGFNASMNSSILIRSALAGPDAVVFSVGAGIVADSDPEREYEETLAKAEGMLRAFDAVDAST